MKDVPSQIFRNGCYGYRKAVLAASHGAGAPAIKTRRGTQSVILTKELFSIQNGRLRIASSKQELGFVRWKAHREFETPNMLVVSVEADGRWYAGFSYDNGTEVPQLPAARKRQSDCSASWRVNAKARAVEKRPKSALPDSKQNKNACVKTSHTRLPVRCAIPRTKPLPLRICG